MYYVPIEMTKEYVRKNEIYTTVNGEIIRITPDMIKATPHNLHLQTKPPSKMLSG